MSKKGDTTDLNLEPICSAISLHIADWGGIDPSPCSVLNHWFFVIGNRIQVDDINEVLTELETYF